MPSQNYSDTFYFALVSFLLQAKQQVVATSGSLGLTGIQALTLLMVDTIEAPSMSRICKLYDCDASNITGIIDGLEQKGLVSRQPHPNDRRVKVIRLETAGKKMQAKVIHRLAETSDHLFSGLDSQEREQFEGLIKKLAPYKR
jgi:DNA-binding MarR family transcriptional regulator